MSDLTSDQQLTAEESYAARDGCPWKCGPYAPNCLCIRHAMAAKKSPEGKGEGRE